MKGQVLRAFILLILVALIGAAAWLLIRADSRKHVFKQTSANLPEFDLDRRPSNDRLLFDYAGVLEDLAESTNAQLQMIAEQYGLEALIVSLPSLENKRSIEETASTLFNSWAIGKQYQGRGLLLLLADKEKEVKLESAYALEDVFTDIFCGHAADVQLEANYRKGNLNTGLIAVMEEIELRASLKFKGVYTTASIADLDREFLSGGAGVKRGLDKHSGQQEVSTPKNVPGLLPGESQSQSSIYTPSALLALGLEPDARFPAGRTPQKAWKIFMDQQRFAAKHQNDRYAKRHLSEREGKDFEVIQNEDFAVISFGKERGWTNTPFLYVRGKAGWQQDIVSMRKYVRYGRAPAWGVEWADHPYMPLFKKFPYWMQIDIPLEGSDRYDALRDAEYVVRIKEVERQLKQKPQDFDLLLELGRLGTVTSRRPNLVYPHLRKAKSLRPKDARPYKYLAIYNVGSSYQYKNALVELKEYVEINEDAFGRSFLGYVYYQLNDYAAAVDELKRASELDAANVYTQSKLARAYTQLYKKATKLDPRALVYKKSAREAFERASSIGGKENFRVKLLRNWLRKQGILG